eukprot:2123603-Amphidinium_carterae.1
MASMMLGSELSTPHTSSHSFSLSCEVISYNPQSSDTPVPNKCMGICTVTNGMDCNEQFTRSLLTKRG